MTRLCVRCGQRPRDEDVYLCSTCRTDPETEDEVRSATQQSVLSGRWTQRQWLVDNAHWYGYWGRKQV